MSKPVRLPDSLYDELQKLAKAEQRSLANMVAVLLIRALREWETQGLPAATQASAPATDPHFKPDFK
jgi:hypothetical protein